MHAPATEVPSQRLSGRKVFVRNGEVFFDQAEAVACDLDHEFLGKSEVSQHQ